MEQDVRIVCEILICKSIPLPAKTHEELSEENRGIYIINRLFTLAVWT